VKFWYIVYRDETSEPAKNEGKQLVCIVPDWDVKTYGMRAEEAYHEALKEIYMKAAQKSEGDWKQEGFKKSDAMGGQLEAPGHWEDVERYIEMLMKGLLNKPNQLTPPPEDPSI
jgi:hypothetical protein